MRTFLHKYFLLQLMVIAVCGLMLRLVQYDSIPPFGETKDEFIYPWAGMTILQAGTPVSWSPFGSYPEKFTLPLWGETFSMVSPYIEKPFLYPLLTGSLSLLTGATDFSDVRLSTIRLLPIFLNAITIILIGLWVRRLVGPSTAILAALLYATIPQIVLGNRLSLTENLLILLTVSAWYLVSLLPEATEKNSNRAIKQSNNIVHLIGILCGLSILTKQVGFVLPLSIGLYLLFIKQTKHALIVGAYSAIAFVIHPAFALYYGWDVYTEVTEELRRAHALGLPEAIPTLFRFPGIGHKESIFLDGGMLAGFILLFAAPFTSINKKLLYQLLLFPFLYILFLVLGEGGQTWYGWHIFPLYPFVAIMLTHGAAQLYREYTLFHLLFFIMLLGVSSIRFILLIHPTLVSDWQLILTGMIGISSLMWLHVPMRRYSLVGLLCIYTIINIYTIFNLDRFYETRPQPLTRQVEFK